MLVHWEQPSEVAVGLGWIRQFMLGIWEYYIRIKFTNTPTSNPNTGNAIGYVLGIEV
jgi:hypothetical protein